MTGTARLLVIEDELEAVKSSTHFIINVRKFLLSRGIPQDEAFDWAATVMRELRQSWWRARGRDAD